MLYILLIILGILNILGLSGLISVYIYGYRKNKHITISEIPKKILVIVPCKGLIPNLEYNLRAICSQTKVTYEVLIILDSNKDPAFTLIHNIVKTTSHANVVFAEKIPTASGKISALITGLKHTKDSEIYVFADSDIHPHPTWLNNLVQHLDEKDIGATTGFRWYFPTNLKTTLIAAWNMATMSSLYHPLSNYTWGGSTAIKKTIFNNLNIENHWRTGFSDDLILTQIIKKNGYKIKFVPQSIVESPEETTITTFLRWGTQQFTWMRWYYPFTYYITFFGFLFLQFNIPIGIIAFLYGYYIPGLLLISTIALEMIYGLIGIITLQKFIQYPKKRLGKTWLYIVLMPLVFVLFTYNYILSSIKQEITWAGTSYRKKDR